MDRPHETALWTARHTGAIADRPRTIAWLHPDDQLGRRRTFPNGEQEHTGIVPGMRSMLATILCLACILSSCAPPRTTNASDDRRVFERSLIMPIEGVRASDLHNTFLERRAGGKPHEATDIIAPRGTPVHAVDDGVIQKLFLSKPGGI